MLLTESHFLLFVLPNTKQLCKLEGFRISGVASLMHRFNQYIPPISLGLVVALWAVVLFPRWFGTENAITAVHSRGGFVSSYSESINKAIPSVVNIYTTKVMRRKLHPLLDDPLFSHLFNLAPRPKERTETSLGSGVIMHSDGLVITNNHVIEGADEILVFLQDGRTSTAQIVGTDPDTDLALLKIHLQDLPSITIGQSDLLNVGDVVLAIGNPFGFGQTVTLGIVSATGRNQVGISQYENFIQTDAAINPGNSGGALINAQGELVGINTAIFSKSGGSMGIGFAIPVSSTLKVIKQLAQHGRVVRGWLGVETQRPTPSYRAALNLPQTINGLVITHIEQNSPGLMAGLQPGDLITHIDKISAANGREIKEYIAQLTPGNWVSIRYVRGEQYYNTRAKLGEKQSY